MTQQLWPQGYSSSSVMLAYWARSASFLFLDSSDTSLVFTTIWACFSIMLAMAWTSAAVWKKQNYNIRYPDLQEKSSIMLAVYTQICALATNCTSCTVGLRDNASGKLFLSSNRSVKLWGKKQNNTFWYKHFFHATKRKLSAVFRNCFAIVFQEITPQVNCHAACSKTQE